MKDKPGHLKAEVISVEVDNPHFSSDHAESITNPKRVYANINMRESPALWMFSHNWIDSAQFEAAGILRKLFEVSEVGVSVSMAFDKEPVDGGKPVERFSDRARDARNRLVDIHKFLGKEKYELVRKVCGYCIFIKEIEATQWGRRVKTKLFKEALSDLVEFFDLETGKHANVRSSIKKSST